MLLPRGPFLAGAIDLQRFLVSMPSALRRASQAEVRQQARRFTVSTDFDRGDLVHALLHRARNVALGRADALIGGGAGPNGTR